MRNIKVYKAGVDDLSDLVMIQKVDGFDHAYYLDETRLSRLLSRGEEFVIAKIDDMLAGFASVDV